MLSASEIAAFLYLKKLINQLDFRHYDMLGVVRIALNRSSFRIIKSAIS